MRTRIAITFVLVAFSRAAVAQAPEEAPPTGPEWKAEAQAGLIMASGNSRSMTVAAGAKASRKAGKNKFEVEGQSAFARASLELVTDVNANGTIDGPSEILRESQTTTNMYLAKARYDRFLTERNTLFVAGLVSGNEPAGKEFVGGGQAGYSRVLLADDVHALSSELGYDLSYENFVAAGDSVTIHSGRASINYDGKIADDSTVTLGAEVLCNLNTIEIGVREAEAFKDTRFNGKFALTSNVWKNVSFRFSFTAKVDNFPAPKPPLALPFGPTFSPAAEKVDTLTEASLIINFI